MVGKYEIGLGNIHTDSLRPGDMLQIISRIATISPAEFTTPAPAVAGFGGWTKEAAQGALASALDGARRGDNTTALLSLQHFVEVVAFQLAGRFTLSRAEQDAARERTAKIMKFAEVGAEVGNVVHGLFEGSRGERAKEDYILAVEQACVTEQP